MTARQACTTAIFILGILDGQAIALSPQGSRPTHHIFGPFKFRWLFGHRHAADNGTEDWEGGGGPHRPIPHSDEDDYAVLQSDDDGLASRHAHHAHGARPGFLKGFPSLRRMVRAFRRVVHPTHAIRLATVNKTKEDPTEVFNFKNGLDMPEVKTFQFGFKQLCCCYDMRDPNGGAKDLRCRMSNEAKEEGNLKGLCPWVQRDEEGGKVLDSYHQVAKPNNPLLPGKAKQPRHPKSQSDADQRSPCEAFDILAKILTGAKNDFGEGAPMGESAMALPTTNVEQEINKRIKRMKETEGKMQQAQREVKGSKDKPGPVIDPGIKMPQLKELSDYTEIVRAQLKKKVESLQQELMRIEVNFLNKEVIEAKENASNAKQDEKKIEDKAKKEIDAAHNETAMANQVTGEQKAQYERIIAQQKETIAELEQSKVKLEKDKTADKVQSQLETAMARAKLAIKDAEDTKVSRDNVEQELGMLKLAIGHADTVQHDKKVVGEALQLQKKLEELQKLANGLTDAREAIEKHSHKTKSDFSAIKTDQQNLRESIPRRVQNEEMEAKAHAMLETMEALQMMEEGTMAAVTYITTVDKNDGEYKKGAEQFVKAKQGLERAKQLLALSMEGGYVDKYEVNMTGILLELAQAANEFTSVEPEDAEALKIDIEENVGILQLLNNKPWWWSEKDPSESVGQQFIKLEFIEQITKKLGEEAATVNQAFTEAKKDKRDAEAKQMAQDVGREEGADKEFADVPDEGKKLTQPVTAEKETPDLEALTENDEMLEQTLYAKLKLRFKRDGVMKEEDPLYARWIKLFKARMKREKEEEERAEAEKEQAAKEAKEKKGDNNEPSAAPGTEKKKEN